MLDLTILLCRYAYIFMAAFFIWNSAVYILCERKIVRNGMNTAVSAQRIVIIMLVLTAYTLLSVDKDNDGFNFNTVIDGVAVVVFLMVAMRSTSRIYKNSCPLLWNCLFFLLSVGFVMLERLNQDLMRRQLIFCAAGYAVTLFVPVVLKIIPRFEKLEFLYIIFGLFLLTAIFVPGLGSEQFGASNWLQIGAVSFQPSEFAKLLFVLYLASAFSKYTRLLHPRMIMACLITAVILIILVLQKDLGGALLFFMTFLVLFFVTTGRTILSLLAIVSASGAAFISYYLFAHVRDRVSAWRNPFADIDRAGYQIAQSLFAITTFGALGSGLTRGYSKTIPVVERDMIFAAICEEFGGIFGILLILIYLIIISRGIHTAVKCGKNEYEVGLPCPHSLLSLGLTALLAFQTFIIIGGVIKLIPLTGITLPFISYGGTSVFISFIMVGLLQWLYSD